MPFEELLPLLPRAPQPIANQSWANSQKDVAAAQSEQAQAQVLQKQAQIQQQAIDQQKRDQRDQEIIQRAILNGGGDWDKTIKDAVTQGASPKAYYGLQDQRLKLRKAGAEADTEEAKAAFGKAQEVARKGKAYLSLPPEAQSRNEADLRQAMGIPDDQPIDLDAVRKATFQGMLVGDQYQNDREEATAARAKQKFDTEQPLLEATTQRTLNDPGLLPPPARATADQAAATQAALATERAAVDSRERERINMERQRVGLEQSKNTRDQAIYNQTYGAGSNDALRAVDPKLRVQASSAAQKAANEYQTAAKAGEDIQSLIDAARQGNKQAGTNLPLVGVEALNALQGIKRINRAEIDQYQGAGSLLDKIQGRIQNITSGQPIPADVLADIESLHQTLTGNALKAYNDKLNGINQNYRSDFKPIPSATQKATDAQTHKVGDIVVRNGKREVVTEINPDNRSQFKTKPVN